MGYEIIYRAIERGTTEVPVGKILSGGSLDVYPEVQSAGYFNFSLRANRLILTAGNFVGLIPLNKSIAIFVEPKIAKANWLYIVERVNGTLRKINYVRDYGYDEQATRPLIEFLIDAFCTQLFPIEHDGMLAQYIARHERTSFPKGRINFKSSIKYAWSRGYLRSVNVDYHLFSRDIPHNRLIRYALHLSTMYAKSLPQQPIKLLESLFGYTNLFSQIPLDYSRAYIDSVLLDLQNGAIPSIRSYYIDALRTALLIVENTGINPSITGVEDAFTLSFVVNMEVVFEQYCQIVLKENAQQLGHDIIVKNQDEGRIPLFGHESRDKRRAEPDIVISKQSGKTLLIADVKYKPSPNRNDINQVITYAVAYRIHVAALICFSDETTSPGWEYLGEVGQQVNVWIYRVPLDQTNLQENELTLIEDIEQMLQLIEENP